MASRQPASAVASASRSTSVVRGRTPAIAPISVRPAYAAPATAAVQARKESRRRRRCARPLRPRERHHRACAACALRHPPTAVGNRSIGAHSRSIAGARASRGRGGGDTRSRGGTALARSSARRGHLHLPRRSILRPLPASPPRPRSSIAAVALRSPRCRLSRQARRRGNALSAIRRRTSPEYSVARYGRNAAARRPARPSSSSTTPRPCAMKVALRV